jgi:hypothetical protein
LGMAVLVECHVGHVGRCPTLAYDALSDAMRIQVALKGRHTPT